MIPWLQHLAAKLSVNVNLKLSGKHPHLAQLCYTILHNIVFPCFRVFGKMFGNPTNYMHSYGAWFYEQNPENIMFPHKDITFEGYTFEGPANPEELCRIAYGKYMELPPKNKRDRHKIDIVFID